jgi:excinuclease ABC subunit C
VADPARAAFEAGPFLENLTTRPGVYRMLDSGGAILYVGKARNLKSRVTSYFRAAGMSAKTMALVARIADIEITVTSSETEALLLEQSLIKAHRPPYNIVLRDDKSYPYIALTDDPDYPRLTFHRGAKRKGMRYFGPYPSASAVRESLNILQKLFRIRPCEDSYFRNRTRPCLQHQIERCSAPCVRLIDKDDYASDVRHAVMFLEGRNQVILDEFKAAMDEAASRLEFERAAHIRDQIGQLRRVQEQQYVHTDAGEADVFAVAERSGVSCVQGLFLRGGRLLGQRTWFPKNELGVGQGELLEAFLGQYYFGGGERLIPRATLTNVELPGASALADALARTSGSRVEVASAVRSARARWVGLAQENARLALEAYLADRQNTFARFVELQDALGLDEMPERLECFDISHSSGEATVASCVVFDLSGPAKSDYRRFSITGVSPGDDYGALRDALRRRYARLKSGEGKLPDILVIDGGEGQLRQATAVLDELQVDGLTVLSIAKGTTRKAGFETIHLAGHGEIHLSPQCGAMHLLQHLRDEAHRFAISGHRSQRGRKRRVSELEGIRGVGPRRRRELIRHFGSVPAIRAASREEIAKVPGISLALADEIHAALHGE